MFRISRVFETSAVVIVKVSGQVKEATEAAWPAFLDGLRSEGNRWVVLDLSEVTRLDTRAADTLVRRLPENTLLLNCPTDVRNMMQTAGLSEQVLDPNGPERGFLNLVALNNDMNRAVRPGARGLYGVAAA